jgi:transposase
MVRQKRTYSPESRDEAVKMVIETSRPVAVGARELGLVEGTLGNWVNAYRKNHPVEERPLEISGRAGLKELERENRELRSQNEFLKKAAADSRGRRNTSAVRSLRWEHDGGRTGRIGLRCGRPAGRRWRGAEIGSGFGRR